MGGGTKLTGDAKKGKPFDLLAAIAEAGEAGGLGSIAQAGAFCSRTHAVPFRAEAGARSDVGTSVRLMLDTPPQVIGSDGLIGWVEGTIAIAMRGCLTLGYEMTGTVESVDPEQGMGTLSIAGSRRQVA